MPLCEPWKSRGRTICLLLLSCCGFGPPPAGFVVVGTSGFFAPFLLSRDELTNASAPTGCGSLCNQYPTSWSEMERKWLHLPWF